MLSGLLAMALSAALSEAPSGRISDPTCDDYRHAWNAEPQKRKQFALWWDGKASGRIAACFPEGILSSYRVGPTPIAATARGDKIHVVRTTSFRKGQPAPDTRRLSRALKRPVETIIVASVATAPVDRPSRVPEPDPAAAPMVQQIAYVVDEPDLVTCEGGGAGWLRLLEDGDHVHLAFDGGRPDERTERTGVPRIGDRIVYDSPVRLFARSIPCYLDNVQACASFDEAGVFRVAARVYYNAGPGGATRWHLCLVPEGRLVT